MCCLMGSKFVSFQCFHKVLDPPSVTIVFIWCFFSTRPNANFSSVIHRLAQSINYAIWFGGFLHKNNTSCFLLGTVSCVDELDIHNVWMEITPKKILLWGIVKVVNSELFADISKFVGDAVNLKIKFLGTVCMGKSCLFW